ncbi:Uncharacterized protein T01_5966 [Trichinella spiralis]|uniref:RNA-directed DNA polymerase n=1 Tax=Trichinella spiralis TaxID=6334 RepID=A0A0V1BER5_TRISP|nr:Uncharacterized protein T01_5966 [Trichinella spiralis]
MKQQSKRYRPLMLWHLDETHSANRKSEKNVGCTGREQGAKNQRRQPCSKGKYAGTIGEKRKKSYIPFYKYIKQHDSFRNKRKFNRRRKDHADDEGIHRSIRSKILCKNSSKEKKISMVILLQAVQEGRALHTELPTAALQKKKRLLVTTLVFSTKKQKALVSSDEVYTMTVFKCNFRRKFPTNNAMPRRRKDHADDEGIHRSIRSKILCKNSSKEKKISMVILLQAVQEGRALHTELPTDLDLNVTLICMKARKVPFALREKTDAELDKLVEQGVLEPMNHPTQRKSLAKLDLAQAYQQLTVDDATADAQTIITHRGAFRVKRFKIDATGIHPAKAKVQAIQDAPTPKNKQQLQAFLGLLNFYHSFLKDKATVAEQLHRLLDKNARWIWTSKHEKAFRDVKRLLSSDAVLTHYDGEKPMRCIATWFGAVLCHKLSSTQEIPITFYSRTLSTMERNYGQIDKEALAVIAGVKKFHEYLYGRQFTIITDHKPLFGLFVPKKETPQILSPRMLRWSILLNAYDYTINYRPGKEIANADALSRLPKQSTENNDSHNPVILSLETIDNSPLHSKDITRITAKDPILTRVLSWAWRSWPKSVSDERLKPYVTRQHELSIHNGCLLWGSRVIIPLQARHKIFKELHIGHPGIVRMKALSRSYVWWPKLDSEIENLVRTCELCQQSRASPPHAPVHKWESPRIPWSRIHVELAGPIYGKNFLIVVDAFSKWLEVRVLKNTTSESVISCLRQIFSIHGLPDIIVSDNGTQFTSHIFQEYLNKGGIKHITSASFHPSSNGQAERMVRITKEFLKKMTQRDWEYDLANFSFCQHVTPCTTAGKSPAELLMNRRLRTVLDRLQPDVELEDLDKNFEKVRTFQTYDQVYARNYSSEKTWKPATFVTQTGPPSYQVQTEDGQLWPRHIDQRKSNHRKIKLEKKTVEAIPEEDTAVVTTPREESAAASPSPDIESVGQQRSSTQMKIYVPVIDKICLLQQIGIREEILDSIELFLFKSSFKSCIANTYSDFSPYNYSLFAYNEKTSSCSKLHAMPEENIIVNCSEQLHDLQFYKVTHCLTAEGFMYSFEEEVEENVNKINAVKLKATAEICIVERHPFSENFLLKRTKMFFLQSLELCLAHCRVLSVRGKCNAVLFSGEERVCLLLQQNQPLQSRDVMRKSASQFFTVNYCDYNMTESSQRRDYNGRGKKINLHVESMRVQCTVHEIPLLRKHMKHQFLLWNSINFRYCIQFCVQQFQRNLCNAVYFEAEEKTCLHLLLNASQALHEYTESRKETIHFIEKCVEVAERQEYQQESAINRIQSDETSLSSPSRPRSSRTHNVHEQELDFFHYVAAEDVHEQYTKLYEFFEVCKIQVLNIGIIRNAFAIQIRRKIYSLNRCLHICRRHTSCMAILYSKLDHQCKKIFKGRSGNLILVQDDELVLALKECFKDRPAERKCNADPVVYYFKETHEICAVEIYKQKNLTSWEVITISKDVSNFRRYCTVNQELWLICITKEEKTDRQRMEVPRNQPLMYERAASRGVSARQGIKFQSTYLGAPLWREPSYILER